MSKLEGEVREVPFLKNDRKEDAPTTGKADSESAEVPKGNKTVNVDDAQLDETSQNKK